MQGIEEMRFFGSYSHTIDTNHRIIMPAKIKEALYGNGFTIYYKPGENCLRLYATSVWKEMIFNLAYVDDGNDYSELQRQLAANSKNYDLDTQGRFVLPQEFVDAANLTKDIVTIGTGTRAEIWDKETYEKHRAAQNAALAGFSLPY